MTAKAKTTKDKCANRKKECVYAILDKWVMPCDSDYSDIISAEFYNSLYNNVFSVSDYIKTFTVFGYSP